MPATNRKRASPPPASPRNTAKYTNKDGSKYITVSKTQSDSSQPSTPTMATKPSSPNPNPPGLDMSSAPPVNRKKQKRRQKALAKAAAAEQAGGGHAPPASASNPQAESPPLDDQDPIPSDDEADNTLNGGSSSSMTNGHPGTGAKTKKSKKKKKKQQHGGGSAYANDEPPAHPSGMSKDKIWSTSNHEERERIKEFWLGLGEDERKSLVKVEKDAVLKKMKEQQKHTCSCTVCGRKRTAIEEELEGLYDAYYLELEQFANKGEGPPMLPPPSRDFTPQPPRRLPSRYAPQQPSRGRIVEHVADEEDEDDLDEVYSEDEADDDEYSDEEPPEQFQNSYDRDMTDFLTFGNSLQVKGGILTVADDLLKNDGKRFIEMMEQLAERRMAREEDAREHLSSRGYGHPNGSYSNHPHTHPPPQEDEYEDEEDDEEDYEDSQDEEYEEEEDQMTEEQRMEEGRRMFQIFAARMFEQRVLSAYKEKVAKERQDRLLEELEEESRQVDQQKAKKAKNAQKKKDKAAQKKQALAEEKARKEAERAAEEAARLEAERRQLAEQRQKAEDKRKQREAQKKAEEEARLRREAERQRRIREQREKQAEQERKVREAREREKKLREEQRQREKEAREREAREARERKEKQERDKREKEARAAKTLKEAQEAAQRAREERAHARSSAHAHAHAHAHAQANHSSQPTIQIPKRGGPAAQNAAPLPTALAQPPSNPASYASPKIPVATPVIPKAPTPMRTRALSQQQHQQQEAGPGSSAPSQPASMASQDASPHPGTPVQLSPGPGPMGQQDRKPSAGGAALGSQLNQPTPVSPHSAQSKLPAHTPPFQMPAGSSLRPPPGLAPQRPPGFSSAMTPESMFSLGYRPNPNLMIAPPGINGPGGRGFPPAGPMPPPPPGFAHSSTDAFPMNQPLQPILKDGPLSGRSRQGSAGFDGPAGPPSLPIGRPAPIGRPGSLSQGQSRDEDEDTKHLGSRVLVDDDEPLPTDMNTPGSLRNQPPGPRGGFGSGAFMDAGAFNTVAQNPWGLPAAAAAAASQHHHVPPPPPPPPGFANPAWGSSPSIPPGFAVGSPIPALGSMRSSSQPRHVAVRLMLCQACKHLAASGTSDADGYIDLGVVRSRIGVQSGDASITEQDLLNLCDTEGSSSNGGGTFDIKRGGGAAGPGKVLIRWAPDPSDGSGQGHRAVGAPGEIGSPLASQASLRGF